MMIFTFPLFGRILCLRGIWSSGTLQECYSFKLRASCKFRTKMFVILLQHERQEYGIVDIDVASKIWEYDVALAEEGPPGT